MKYVSAIFFTLILLIAGCSDWSPFVARPRTWNILAVNQGGEAWFPSHLPDTKEDGEFIVTDARLVGDHAGIDVLGVYGYDINKAGIGFGAERKLDSNQQSALVPIDSLRFRKGSKDYSILFHLRANGNGSLFTWGVRLYFSRDGRPGEIVLQDRFGLAVVDDIAGDWSEEFHREGKRLGWE